MGGEILGFIPSPIAVRLSCLLRPRTYDSNNFKDGEVILRSRPRELLETLSRYIFLPGWTNRKGFNNME